MNAARKFYMRYEADDKLSVLSQHLIDKVFEFDPISALDYGSGTGKHADVLNRQEVCTIALDISKVNTTIAMYKHALPCVMLADESYLRHFVNIDVVFTCSVLDHIESVDGIIREMKRICNKAVILAEALHHDPEMFYYSHDYESMGFEKIHTGYVGENGFEYFLFVWQKGSFDPINELDTLTIRK